MARLRVCDVFYGDGVKIERHAATLGLELIT